MKHRRAIDEEEKNERKQKILQTAASLLHNAGYDDISMQIVADQSSLAKGTLYLYFQSKEELFLALLREALDGWFYRLQQQLTGTPGNDRPLQIETFADTLADSLQQQEILIKLLPILHSILERNISFEIALEFKKYLHHQLAQTGGMIEQNFSFLNAGQGVEFLLHAYAALIGLQSLASPAGVVARVMQLPEMAVFAVDGNTALRRLAVRVLTGIMIENERRQ